MKKTKVISAIFVVLMVTFPLSSCSPFGTNSQDENSSSTEQQAEKTQSVEYKKGKITDRTFESEYLDLKITFPIGFKFETDDTDENAESQSTSTELQAYSPEGTYIIIYTQELLNQDITVEQYLDGIKTKYLATVLKFNDDLEPITIAEQNYTKLTAKTTSEKNLELVIEHIARKKDNRMIVFCLSYESSKKDIMNSLLQAFTPY
ncbi:MAG: hypothetical protein RUMPE_01242 [Eubacteriales bacterium SKADARSKE-1]|nr:hypothetical protein [Eubacteriales bacterium SKADARSKE-1]